MEIFGGGGGGGGRHHATGDNERVLVGFGVDSDLKMLLKMKRSIALTCGRSTATSTATSTGTGTSIVTSNEFTTLTKKSVCLVDLQIAFKVGRKGSLGQMVLDYFPGRCLDKTCTMTNWLRRPLGRPQMEYAALDAIVCYLVYVQNKHNKERKKN